MLVKITIVYIKNPSTEEISSVCLETAEDYSEFFSNRFINECIIGKKEAYRYYFLQGDKKLYECPTVYLSAEDIEELRSMTNTEIPSDDLSSSEIGKFQGLSFQYGGNKVNFKNKDEKMKFELLLTKN